MVFMTLKKIFLSMAMITISLLMFGGGVPIADSAPIFFSEYVEGSSNNKALEIYNGTSRSIDLSTFSVHIYFNGNSSSSSNISLSGSLGAGGYFTLTHASAESSLLVLADITTSSLSFNGDDAIALVNDGLTLDVIGQIGFDPGTAWNSGGVSTLNSTLRRKLSVTVGDANGLDVFDPSVEWDAFPTDTFDGLGEGGFTPAPVPEPSTILLSSLGILAIGGYVWGRERSYKGFRKFG